MIRYSSLRALYVCFLCWEFPFFKITFFIFKFCNTLYEIPILPMIRQDNNILYWLTIIILYYNVFCVVHLYILQVRLSCTLTSHMYDVSTAFLSTLRDTLIPLYGPNTVPRSIAFLANTPLPEDGIELIKISERCER